MASSTATAESENLPISIEGTILSAQELLHYSKITDKTLPETGGLKSYAPSGEWFEEKQLDCMLRERLQLLSDPRHCKLGDLVFGEWNPEIGKVIVTKPKSKLFEHMGIRKRNQMQLYPEEALFAMELSVLEVQYHGVPLSLREAYATFLPEPCNLQRYKVYAHLTRLGYTVVMHQGRLNITPYEKKIGLDQFNEKNPEAGKSKILLENAGVIEDQKTTEIKKEVEVITVDDSTQINPIVLSDDDSVEIIEFPDSTKETRSRLIDLTSAVKETTDNSPDMKTERTGKTSSPALQSQDSNETTGSSSEDILNEEIILQRLQTKFSPWFIGATSPDKSPFQKTSPVLASQCLKNKDKTVDDQRTENNVVVSSSLQTSVLAKNKMAGLGSRQTSVLTENNSVVSNSQQTTYCPWFSGASTQCSVKDPSEPHWELKAEIPHPIADASDETDLSNSSTDQEQYRTNIDDDDDFCFPNFAGKDFVVLMAIPKHLLPANVEPRDIYKMKRDSCLQPENCRPEIYNNQNRWRGGQNRNWNFRSSHNWRSYSSNQVFHSRSQDYRTESQTHDQRMQIKQTRWDTQRSPNSKDSRPYATEGNQIYQDKVAMDDTRFSNKYCSPGFGVPSPHHTSPKEGGNLLAAHQTDHMHIHSLPSSNICSRKIDNTCSFRGQNQPRQRPRTKSRWDSPMQSANPKSVLDEAQNVGSAYENININKGRLSTGGDRLQPELAHKCKDYKPVTTHRSSYFSPEPNSSEGAHSEGATSSSLQKYSSDSGFHGSESKPQVPNAYAIQKSPEIQRDTDYRPEFQRDTDDRSELQRDTDDRSELQRDTDDRSELQRDTDHRPELQHTDHRSELHRDTDHRSELQRDTDHRPELQRDTDHRPELRDTDHRPELQHDVDYRPEFKQRTDYRQELRDTDYRPELQHGDTDYRSKFKRDTDYRPESRNTDYRPESRNTDCGPELQCDTDYRPELNSNCRKVAKNMKSPVHQDCSNTSSQARKPELVSNSSNQSSCNSSSVKVQGPTVLCDMKLPEDCNFVSLDCNDIPVQKDKKEHGDCLSIQTSTNSSMPSYDPEYNDVTEKGTSETMEICTSSGETFCEAPESLLRVDATSSGCRPSKINLNVSSVSPVPFPANQLSVLRADCPEFVFKPRSEAQKSNLRMDATSSDCRPSGTNLNVFSVSPNPVSGDQRSVLRADCPEFVFKPRSEAQKSNLQMDTSSSDFRQHDANLNITSVSPNPIPRDQPSRLRADCPEFVPKSRREVSDQRTGDFHSHNDWRHGRTFSPRYPRKRARRDDWHNEDVYPSALTKTGVPVTSWAHYKHVLKAFKKMQGLGMKEETVLYTGKVCPLVKSSDPVDFDDMMSKLRIIPQVNLTLEQIPSSSSFQTQKLSFDFDVYLPGVHYRLSNPTLPNLRLVVVGVDDPVPVLDSIVQLQLPFKDGIPLYFAVVGDDVPAFYGIHDVLLPDFTKRPH